MTTDICPWCKMPFVKRTAKQLSCSSRCGSFLRWATRRNQPPPPDRRLIEQWECEALVHWQAEVARMEESIRQWRKLNDGWRRLLLTQPANSAL